MPTSENLRNAFEQSQERKYKKWKESQAPHTGEQKAFDDYIATIPTAGGALDAYTKVESDARYVQADNSIISNIDDFKTENKISRTDNDRTQGNIPNSTNKYGLAFYYRSGVGDGVQVWYSLGSGNRLGEKYERIYKTNQWQPWKRIATTDSVYLKSETYSKTEANNKFAIKGSGGGGGGSRPQVPDLTNNQLKSVAGEFGVNIFPYREMSRDPHFRVQGKTFCTLGESQVKTDREWRQNHLRVYNRLREGEAFTINAKLIEADKVDLGNRQLVVFIEHFGLDGEARHEKLEFAYNETEKSFPLYSHSDSANYSYFSLQIGGHDKPVRGKVELTGHYGRLAPKGVDQRFVFKGYNGVTLKKNHHGTADEYKHYELGDKLNMKLGLLNLKDIDIYYFENTSDANRKLLLIPVPEDAYTPNKFSEEIKRDPQSEKREKQVVNNNLMTNNLCDITPTDDQGNLQDKPFFLKTIETYNLNVGGVPKEVECFAITIDASIAYKWREHLSETQILYRLRAEGDDDKNEIPLQRGGKVFHMANGESIFTHNYGEVKGGSKVDTLKEFCLTFTKSPFGFKDKTILVDEIVSVEDL